MRELRIKEDQSLEFLTGGTSLLKQSLVLSAQNLRFRRSPARLGT